VTASEETPPAPPRPARYRAAALDSALLALACLASYWVAT